MTINLSIDNPLQISFLASTPKTKTINLSTLIS